MKIFICTVSKQYPENYDIGIEAGIWGVTEEYEHRIRRINEGDQLVFYISGVGVFKSLHRIESEVFEDYTPLWEPYKGSYFPYRIKISEPIKISEKPVKSIWHNISFMRGKKAWSGTIQGRSGVFNDKLTNDDLSIIFGNQSLKNNWSDKELSDSVKIYIEMREKDLDGFSYVKKDYYSLLHKKHPSRSEKSFERRMGNISFIYSEAGRRYTKGLKPLSHVGAKVARKLEELISKFENKPIGNYASFNAQVKSGKPNKKPSGSKVPKQYQSLSTSYERDPKVVAWVLDNSNYICECCNKMSPFIKNDGTKYLEVHHLRRLADNGSDVIENCVAICPNCHRELHFGVNRYQLLDKMYSNITRLIRE